MLYGLLCKHILTFFKILAKNSENFLTLQLRSSSFKPKGKLNKCTFLVFLRYIYSVILPKLAECLNTKLPVYRFYILCTNGFDKLSIFVFALVTNRASFVSALPSLNGHLCSWNLILHKVQAFMQSLRKRLYIFWPMFKSLQSPQTVF